MGHHLQRHYLTPEQAAGALRHFGTADAKVIPTCHAPRDHRPPPCPTSRGGRYPAPAGTWRVTNDGQPTKSAQLCCMNPRPTPRRSPPATSRACRRLTCARHSHRSMATTPTPTTTPGCAANSWTPWAHPAASVTAPTPNPAAAPPPAPSATAPPPPALPPCSSPPRRPRRQHAPTSPAPCPPPRAMAAARAATASQGPLAPRCALRARRPAARPRCLPPPTAQCLHGRPAGQHPHL